MDQEKLYAELKLRLNTDLLRLTEELVETPMLHQQAAEACADAIKFRDAVKNALTVATAAASQILRGSEEGGKAPSEAKIASLVPLDPAVIGLLGELEEIQQTVAYWQSLVTGFSEKASSLRRVADLTVSGYLTPNAGHADRREDMAKERAFRQRGK